MGERPATARAIPPTLTGLSLSRAGFDDAEGRCGVHHADHLETGCVEYAAVLAGGAFSAIVDQSPQNSAQGLRIGRTLLANSSMGNGPPASASATPKLATAVIACDTNPPRISWYITSVGGVCRSSEGISEVVTVRP